MKFKSSQLFLSYDLNRDNPMIIKIIWVFYKLNYYRDNNIKQDKFKDKFKYKFSNF